MLVVEVYKCVNMNTAVGKLNNIREDVQNSFNEIRKALEMRKKLLLRQVDVIEAQSLKNINTNKIDEIKFIPDDEIDLLNNIRQFGRFNIDNINFTNDLYYANEDYICPSFEYKELVNSNPGNDGNCNNIDSDNGDDGKNEVCKNEIIADFSNNKSLIKQNVNNLNESIINITLNEAKELIEKSSNNVGANLALNKNNLKQNKINITQSSQTECKSGKNRKPNITINNCNGTINLRNISSLTINCTNQDALNTIKSTTPTSDASIEDNDKNKREEKLTTNLQQVQQFSSETTETSRSSDFISQTKDNDNNSVNCEFYNRLISEIKNTLKQQSHKISNHEMNYQTARGISGGEPYCCSSSDTSTTNDSYNRKLLLKNFENLKIVLENNENDTHPVQIEQWLTEIISETEIEPMQNIEILEHSQINGNDSMT